MDYTVKKKKNNVSDNLSCEKKLKTTKGRTVDRLSWDGLFRDEEFGMWNGIE